MTTNNIITIVAAPKESLIQAVRRALNNAECNCKTVKLVYGGFEALIKAGDSYKTHIHSLKLQALVAQYKVLEAEEALKG